MKRIMPLAAALVAIAVILAPVASATKPAREHIDFDDATFSGICSFTVARHVLVNRSVFTTYSDGTQKITGTFKQRLINLTTGKFIDVNSSGPVIIEYRADGSSTEKDFGRQFERPPGQLLLTTGTVVWEFDSVGNVVSYTQRGGTTQDVCALLA
jgi:hypothetical protein